MNIFFSGSIRGGRSDVDLYAALIESLERHGTVLSEHVGADAVEEKEEAGLSDAEIHERDLTWLRQADVVVAEVTTPSLGVGYEIGRAVEWNTPVLCLYRPGAEHDLSAMLRGNDAVSVTEYRDPTTVAPVLESFVQQHRR